jgi:hypothetical protein
LGVNTKPKEIFFVFIEAMPEFSRYRQPTCNEDDVMEGDLQTIFLYNDIFIKAAVKEQLLQKDVGLRSRFKDFDTFFQSLEEISEQEQAFRANESVHRLLKELGVSGITFLQIAKKPWKVAIRQRVEHLVLA